MNNFPSFRNSRFRLIFIASIVVLTFCNANPAGVDAEVGKRELSSTLVLYVDINSPNGTGRSWLTPYKYLKDALVEAPTFIGQNIQGMVISNVEVWVAQGVYFPDDSALGNAVNDDRSESFPLSTNVRVLGGFNVNDAISQRDWVSKTTILDGDIGNLTNTTDNSYHVVTGDSNDDTAVLDGFIIRNGNADGNGGNALGGGLNLVFSDPLIRNCNIKYNFASYGSAFYCNNSNPVISNSIINTNVVVTTPGTGSVMYNASSEPELINCTIYGNTGPAGCVGIYNTASSGSYRVNIRNSILWNNGIDISDNSQPFVVTDIRYSMIDSTIGTNNLMADPQFKNASSENFKLRLCSPAIDARTNSSSNSNQDYFLNDRIQNTSIDIGAYEHNSINRIYVDKDATGANDGTSWENAYNFFQDGLSEQCNIRKLEVWVAEGHYYPDEGDGYTLGDRDHSFQFSRAVDCYGGFVGIESQIDQRNLNARNTVFSGAINSSATSDNSKNIVEVTIAGELYLDGFSITKGYDDDVSAKGAGLLLFSNSFSSIKNCLFKDNFVGGEGGAIYANSMSDLYVVNCVFTLNEADDGSAIYHNVSNSTIINSTFFGNDGNGGLDIGIIKNVSCNPIITNCILYGSFTAQIANVNSNPTVSYCIIQNGYAGGANIISEDPMLVVDFSYPGLTRCSPAINAGDNNAISELLDYTGSDRIRYGNVDIGAIENGSLVKYVDSDAIGNNDGSSWDNAFNFLQDALSDASSSSSCYEIWVAEGTYYPDEGSSYANDDRDSYFELINDLKLLGGFEGVETSTNERDWHLHTTILSGDIDQNETLDGNSYHLIKNKFTFAEPLEESAIVNGFVLEFGNADGQGDADSDKGGAIYNEYASPTILNNVIRNNYSVNWGGGLYLFRSDSDIFNNIFLNNKSMTNGGAIYINLFGPEVYNNTFVKNEALSGSGIYCHSQTSAIISNSLFWDNENQDVRLTNFSTATNCIVQGGLISGGTNIIDADPKFTFGPTHPYSLQSCSPAIDAGDNAAINTTIDFAGNPRFHDATNIGTALIDIGAHELQSDYTQECPCLEELILTGMIDGGTYEASISITCDGRIESGSDVIFNAPVINLSEEFEIEDMGTLETQTAGCESN